MPRSLTRKLVLAFLAVSVVGALLAVVMARWMMVQEFNQLILDQSQTAFIERAVEYYELTGSWQGVNVYFRQVPWPPLQKQPKPPRGQEPIIPQQAPFVFKLVDQSGVVVVPGGPYRPGQTVDETELAKGEAVLVDGEVIGRVIASGEPPEFSEREEYYLAGINRALFYSAIGAAAVALVLGILLARGLTRPLRELTIAIREMAKGKLGQQVPVRSEDEIGELAESFNQMSMDLFHAYEARRRMTADIAHDLRTPLTVLGGYLEAMQDDVLRPTPERLETMNTEIQGLILLVEDLRLLSLVDSGNLILNREWTGPQELLERTAAAFSHQADEQFVQLLVESNSDLPQVFVDSERMAQVLGNLVTNALRFTPEGGVIRLQCSVISGQLSAVNGQATDQYLRITVTDTGQGIPADMLPQIFKRFYRGSQAREQSHGETGLGLAIAKSIVETHGGSINVESEGQGKGSAFTILLPLSG